MKIGYARVSTKEQNLDSQIDQLKELGCEKIFQEKVSGKNSDNRVELQKMLTVLREGDTVVVYKLDRLARSLRDLLNLVNDFNRMNVSFVSINDHIDTSTPQGRLIFNIFGSLAEFEREIIRSRTIAGLESARARGRNGGRPEGLSKQAIAKSKLVVNLYKQQTPVNEISSTLGISKTTMYKYLRYHGVTINSQKIQT